MDKQKVTDETYRANRTFGRQLRNAIEAKGLTMVEFGKSLGYTSSATISAICSGDRGMGYPKKLKAAKSLGLELDDLTQENILSPEKFRILMDLRVALANLKDGSDMLKFLGKNIKDISDLFK